MLSVLVENTKKSKTVSCIFLATAVNDNLEEKQRIFQFLRDKFCLSK